MVRKRKSKTFLVRFKKIKDLPLISGKAIIRARDKGVARRKFKRTSVFRSQKILGVTEIK